jgi:hypothetical protein
MWLRLFVEHLVCDPEIKGLETPFKQAQPPAKKCTKPTPNNGAQSKSGFVPKNYEKNGKNGEFLMKLGFGVYMEKMGNGGNLVAGDGCKWRREAGGGE